jgi:hypothetical protein
MSKRLCLVGLVVVFCCVGFLGALEAAPRGEVKRLRLVDNNHAPLKLVVVHTSSTARFVKDLFQIVKLINERENLPVAERLKLHIVPSSGNPVASLGISAADAEKFVEVNPKFSSSDIWAQDCMELCSAQVDASTEFVPAVFDSNRGRGLGGLPRALADLWNLAYVKNPSTAQSHGDYGGNIEYTPFDDVLVIGNTLTSACKSFFEKMGYAGRLFTPDTAWLSVGHIDEYMMFIPTAHAPGGYSILRADPLYALELVAASPDEDLDKVGNEARFLKEVKKVVNARKRDPNMGRGTAAGDFIELNQKIADIIDKNVGELKAFIRKVTNDPDRDFNEVAWPGMFEGRNGPRPSGCHAFLPGVVNLLVLRNHLIVPATYLPAFDKAITARFRAQGNIVHFVDDRPYHNSMGEIHCGTNVLRHLDRTVVKREQVRRVQELKNVFRRLHQPNQ